VPHASPLESGELVKELQTALKKGRSPLAAAAGAPGNSVYPRDMRSNEPIDAPADRAKARNATDRSENVTQESPRNSARDGASGSDSASAGRASGHEAGEARDDAGNGVSRVRSEALSVRQRDVTARTATLARQADMAQPAAFEDERAMHAGARSMPSLVGLPALPPAAENMSPLTPTQAAYVQAWLKTQRHR
jgi:hypothetical protein